jgi:hypothetical protein
MNGIPTDKGNRCPIQRPAAKSPARLKARSNARAMRFTRTEMALAPSLLTGMNLLTGEIYGYENVYEN